MGHGWLVPPYSRGRVAPPQQGHFLSNCWGCEDPRRLVNSSREGRPNPQLRWIEPADDGGDPRGQTRSRQGAEEGHTVFSGKKSVAERADDSHVPPGRKRDNICCSETH
jgi:hypothetical protein